MASIEKGKLLNAGIAIGKKDLLFEAIDFAVAARSDDPTKYHMNGVHIVRTGRHLSFVTTDGRRLHWVEDAEGSIENYLNAQGIDTNGLLGNTYSVMKSAGSVVIGEEIDCDYPDWFGVVDRKWAPSAGVCFSKDQACTDGIYQMYRMGYAVKADHLAAIYKHGENWSVGKQENGAVRFARKANYGVAYTALSMPMLYDDPLVKEGNANAKLAKELEAARKKNAELESRYRILQGINDRLHDDLKACAETDKNAGALDKAPAAGVIEARRVEVPAIEYKPETKAVKDAVLEAPKAPAEPAKGGKRYTKEEKARLRKERADEATEQYTSLLNSVDNDMEKLYAMFNAINARSPCAKFSTMNKAIVIANGTLDARSFKQWIQARRNVKKGARAFYIYQPVVFRDTELADEDGNPITEAVAWGLTPVFRYEDTEPMDDTIYIYEPVRETPEVMSNAA